MKNIYSAIHGDKIIWWVVFLLSLVSIAMVYKTAGSLAYRFQNGNTEYYLIKHLLMLVLGIGIIYFTHLLKYKYFSRLSQILLIISIPLLLLTMLVGQSSDSADRWLEIPGIGVSFQTSDLAKLALITYLARVLHKRQEGQTYKEIFLPIIAPIFLVCGLIVKVNFSTAALIFGTSMVLLFIGRLPFKYILYTVGIAIASFAIFIMVAITVFPDNNRVQTWINRVKAWGGDKVSEEDTEANYQSNLAKATIVSGGVFGNWFGGRNENPSPPQSFSDFMYASLIKEVGFIGGVLCIVLYLLLFYRSIRVAVKSESTFAMLLVIGCSISLIFQAFSNMGVAVGLFPVTGQPLPYLSMGGTSLWFTSISLGIILSVSKDVYDKQSSKEEVATGNH
ncbi:MAG: FtsW/RodA/SpoVE family cell cycle protein [Flavobacteriales bacterium]